MHAIKNLDGRSRKNAVKFTAKEDR